MSRWTNTALGRSDAIHYIAASLADALGDDDFRRFFFHGESLTIRFLRSIP